jgi:two-component system chemotaxis response regulator CheY
VPTSDSLPFHVLIIDDQKSMRGIIRQLLSRGGISGISEAENGEQAIELLNKTQNSLPDVILCDLYMDKMDGMEFVNRVRRDKEKPYYQIPVLLLTGEKDAFVLDVAKQAGAARILTKPISSEQLVLEIKQVIGFAG